MKKYSFNKTSILLINLLLLVLLAFNSGAACEEQEFQGTDSPEFVPLSEKIRDFSLIKNMIEDECSLDQILPEDQDLFIFIYTKLYLEDITESFDNYNFTEKTINYKILLEMFEEIEMPQKSQTDDKIISRIGYLPFPMGASHCSPIRLLGARLQESLSESIYRDAARTFGTELLDDNIDFDSLPKNIKDKFNNSWDYNIWTSIDSAGNAVKTAMKQKCSSDKECVQAGNLIAEEMDLRTDFIDPGSNKVSLKKYWKEVFSSTKYRKAINLIFTEFKKIEDFLLKDSNYLPQKDLWQITLNAMETGGFTGKEIIDSALTLWGIISGRGPSLLCLNDLYSHPLNIPVITKLAYIDSIKNFIDLKLTGKMQFNIPSEYIIAEEGYGTPYHFWLSAFLSRILVKKGISFNTSVKSVYFVGEAYEEFADIATNKSRYEEYSKIVPVGIFTGKNNFYKANLDKYKELIVNKEYIYLTQMDLVNYFTGAVFGVISDSGIENLSKLSIKMSLNSVNQPYLIKLMSEQSNENADNIKKTRDSLPHISEMGIQSEWPWYWQHALGTFIIRSQIE